ncbi:MAG: hypothetical protein M1834_001506 [Cirrosporium novae-zelandiae]|nr:MAG: hypothetical protein M1834_004023 [Cirrosporium novae-zelandiae]KAI9735491.1 MAG: hypothetical protein M1834_001506 [Cirrosporium novae-zelandiae]
MVAGLPKRMAFFPSSWILSTGESRTLEGDTQQKSENGSVAIPQAAEQPPERIRESVPPAVSFLNQADLANHTGVPSGASRRKEKIVNVDTSNQDKHSQGPISIPSTKVVNNRPAAQMRGIGTVMKKFFTNSKADRGKSLDATKFSPERVEGPRKAFQWPEHLAPSSQDSLQDSSQAISRMDQATVASSNQLTSDTLKAVAELSPSNHNYMPYRIPALRSGTPLTGGTGISSTSSSYADVPSRLPRFSPGYSPMS